MSELKLVSIPEVKRPILPLEPIVTANDPLYAEIKYLYDKLQTECNRLSDLRLKATVPEEGVVQSESEFTCSVEEYNAMLSDYMSARQSYIERYQDKLETADMIREKIRKMDDELKRLDEEPEIKLAGIPNENEVPDPDEPWDKFMGRIKNTMSMVCDGMKQALRSAEGSVTKLRIMSRRCEEEEKLRDMESNHCITC